MSSGKVDMFSVVFFSLFFLNPRGVSVDIIQDELIHEELTNYLLTPRFSQEHEGQAGYHP